MPAWPQLNEGKLPTAPPSGRVWSMPTNLASTVQRNENKRITLNPRPILVSYF